MSATLVRAQAALRPSASPWYPQCVHSMCGSPLNLSVTLYSLPSLPASSLSTVLALKLAEVFITEKRYMAHLVLETLWLL